MAKLTENARNFMNAINNYHPTEEELRTVFCFMVSVR